MKPRPGGFLSRLLLEIIFSLYSLTDGSDIQRDTVHEQKLIKFWSPPFPRATLVSVQRFCCKGDAGFVGARDSMWFDCLDDLSEGIIGEA